MWANSAAVLFFGIGVMCSAAGWVQFALAGLAAPGVPAGSVTQQTIADGVWRKGECLIALEQALMQNWKSSGVTVQLRSSVYYVDVTGWPSTVPHPVANVLCQITGDNSDAIGVQLCFLTSGSGVKQ